MPPEKQKCGLSPQKISEYIFFDKLKQRTEIQFSVYFSDTIFELDCFLPLSLTSLKILNINSLTRRNTDLVTVDFYPNFCGCRIMNLMTVG